MLVNTYPSIDLALVSANEFIDMVDHNCLQLGLVPDAADPVGKLRVPHGGVSTDVLLVCGSPVHQVVCGPKGEGSLTAFSGVPLHAVLRCHLAKVVLDNLRIGAFLEETLVCGNANILLAFCLERSIKVALRAMLATAADIGRRAWRRSRTGFGG